MQLEETRRVALQIAPSEPVESLRAQVRAMVGDTGAVVDTARVRFARTMRATLEGQGFEITPKPEESIPVAVSATTPTDWVWEVTPHKTGNLILWLSLDAILSVDRRETPRVFRVFIREIPVTATWSQRTEMVVKSWWAQIIYVLGALALLGRALLALLRRWRRNAPA